MPDFTQDDYLRFREILERRPAERERFRRAVAAGALSIAVSVLAELMLAESLPE